MDRPVSGTRGEVTAVPSLWGASTGQSRPDPSVSTALIHTRDESPSPWSV